MHILEKSILFILESLEIKQEILIKIITLAVISNIIEIQIKSDLLYT